MQVVLFGTVVIHARTPSRELSYNVLRAAQDVSAEKVRCVEAAVLQSDVFEGYDLNVVWYPDGSNDEAIRQMPYWPFYLCL